MFQIKNGIYSTNQTTIIHHSSGFSMSLTMTLCPVLPWFRCNASQILYLPRMSQTGNQNSVKINPTPGFNQSNKFIEKSSLCINNYENKNNKFDSLVNILCLFLHIYEEVIMDASFNIQGSTIFYGRITHFQNYLLFPRLIFTIENRSSNDRNCVLSNFIHDPLCYIIYRADIGVPSY